LRAIPRRSRRPSHSRRGWCSGRSARRTIRSTRPGGMRRFHRSRLLSPWRVSGVDYDAVVGSSQFMVFPFLVSSERRGFGRVGESGFHSTIRGHGAEPRPQGSHTTPGPHSLRTASVTPGCHSARHQLRGHPGGSSDHPPLEPVAR
jgi:hypothetical protein